MQKKEEKKKKKRRQGVGVPTERSKGRSGAGSCTTTLHGAQVRGGGAATRAGSAEKLSKTAYFPPY